MKAAVILIHYISNDAIASFRNRCICLTGVILINGIKN
jgi:hypothetical protein